MSELPAPSGKKGKRAPVVIPHHSGGHSEESEGNWLVSYADMMTLLVGFFVILLSFSSTDSDKLEKMKMAITQEFGGTYKKPFDELAKRIKTALSNAGLGEQYVIKQTDAGIEISFQGAVFFAVGSADVKAESSRLISNLISVLLKEAKDFNIYVEGHTDDVPIASGIFHNNWELSSIRACRVLDAFVEAGFDIKKLTAIGFGDARPIVPNRDANGNSLPENQTQNRRVVVKVLKNNDKMIESKSGNDH